MLGYGVFAKRPIALGTKILEYKGVLTDVDPSTYGIADTYVYELQFKGQRMW